MLKLLILLATAHVLPLAIADCSPYLKEGPAETRPEPEKCWTCPKANQGFGGEGLKPLPDTEDDGGKSWWRFYCTYTRDEGRDENDNPYKKSTIFCHYDVNGNLRVADAYCVDKAVPVPKCTPSRPYSGKNETCCGPNCQLQTDQCYSCPPVEGSKFIDVTATPSILTCLANWWSGGHTPAEYKFDARTGAPLVAPSSDTKKPAPLREGCTPKPISEPGANCPSGATHDQCVNEAKQDAYRSFVGWNRCPSKADYCKYRTVSNNCWACPTLDGTDAVDESSSAKDYGSCTYYKRNTSGDLESANTRCSYNFNAGKLESASAGNKLTCPPQAGKDLTCQRLKDAPKK